jgi:hypothetical protein
MLPNFELKLEIPNIMLVYDFKMAVNLTTIFKMAAKMRKISKCSNFNKNWYVRFFLNGECDGDKSDLKMASYFFTGTHVLVYVMYSVPDEDYSRNVLCALN